MTVHHVSNDDRGKLRGHGSPEQGASASLMLIGGGVAEEGVCELSFKELPGASDLTSQCSCISLLAVGGTCQMCSLPQGLCTYHPFNLELSSLDVQVAAVSLK